MAETKSSFWHEKTFATEEILEKKKFLCIFSSVKIKLQNSAYNFKFNLINVGNKKNLEEIRPWLPSNRLKKSVCRQEQINSKTKHWQV